MRQASGHREELLVVWESTTKTRENTGKVCCVSSEQRKEDKDTKWRNEEVQRKNLRKMKNCDCHGEEEIRQEYQDARHRAKRDLQ